MIGLMQPENARTPMLVTLLGIVTLVRLVQEADAAGRYETVPKAVERAFTKLVLVGRRNFPKVNAGLAENCCELSA